MYSCVTVCFLFFWLNVMLVRFIHIVKCGNILFTFIAGIRAYFKQASLVIARQAVPSLILRNTAPDPVNTGTQ